MLNQTLKFIDILKGYPDKLPEKITINDATNICNTFISYFAQTTFNSKEVELFYNALISFCRALRNTNRLSFNEVNAVMNNVTEIFESLRYTDTRKDEFLAGMHYIYDNRDKDNFVNDVFNDLKPQTLLSTIYEYNEVVKFLKSETFKYALEVQIYNIINGLSIGVVADSEIGNTKPNNSKDFIFYCKIAEVLGFYDNSNPTDRKRFLLECAAVSGLTKTENSATEMTFTEDDLNLLRDTTNLFGA